MANQTDTNPALARFLQHYRVKSYKKGELILVEGEVPPVAYVIKTGIVKSYNITSDGQEKPITFDTKNELFPIGWIFRKIRQAQFFYEALSDTEVYCVPRDELTTFLKANNQITTTYDALLSNYLNFQMRVNALEQSKAAEKVVHTLHFLAVSFGSPVKVGIVKIDLPLTQQDMANIMGLTRETTGIELKKLERAGVIEYRRQKYVIHTAKLSELLDVEFGGGRITTALV